MAVAVQRQMLSPRAVAVSVMLFAFAASAQINILTPLTLTTSTGQSTFTFGTNSCTAQLPVTWTNNSLIGTPCGDLQLWITSGECGDMLAEGDVSLPSVISALVFTVRTGTFNVDLTQLPGFNQADGGVCGDPGIQVTNKVCGAIQLQSGLTCIFNHAQALEVDYDTEAPPPPNIDSVQVEDGALGVSVSGSSDTLYVDVQAKGPDEEDFGHDIQIYLANTGTGVVQGLANGVEYQLRAFAVDAAGNASDDSSIVTGTPLHAISFWENYRDAGGGEQGCTVVGGWPVIAAVTLVRLLRSRRRTRR